MIDEVPADDAKKIAFFATDPVSWWLMTKEDGEVQVDPEVAGRPKHSLGQRLLRESFRG